MSVNQQLTHYLKTIIVPPYFLFATVFNIIKVTSTHLLPIFYGVLFLFCFVLFFVLFFCCFFVARPHRYKIGSNCVDLILIRLQQFFFHTETWIINFIDITSSFVFVSTKHKASKSVITSWSG